MAQGMCLASCVVRQSLTIGQAHPEPPLELIERWQGYLNESREKCKRFDKYGWDEKNTDAYFEEIWQRDSREMMSTNQPWQELDEEELIQCLECVVEMM
jgi:hypothetical protein